MKKYVSRRKFLKFGLASSALPLTGMSMSLSSSSVKRYNYKRSIIIDNLASPGLFNVPGRLDNPLTDEMFPIVESQESQLLMSRLVLVVMRHSRIRFQA